MGLRGSQHRRRTSARAPAVLRPCATFAFLSCPIVPPRPCPPRFFVFVRPNNAVHSAQLARTPRVTRTDVVVCGKHRVLNAPRSTSSCSMLCLFLIALLLLVERHTWGCPFFFFCYLSLSCFSFPLCAMLVAKPLPGDVARSCTQRRGCECCFSWGRYVVVCRVVGGWLHTRGPRGRALSESEHVLKKCGAQVA